MKLAWITLAAGLAISVTSGYFSIIGLGQLFSSSFWSVVIMGAVIEGGKIVAATWLHSNWYNTSVSKLHKAYLVFAIIICMLITSLGIFGFLSKAHIDQQLPVAEQLTSVKGISEQIKTLQADLDQLQKNLDTVNELSKTKNSPALDAQRSRILRQMDKDRKQIQELNTELLKTKKSTSQFTLELGPAKYLADIIFGDGEQNVDRAVQIFILMIMFVFDPLALVLILSANHSFKLKKSVPKKVIIIDESAVETIEEPTSTDEPDNIVKSMVRWFQI